MRYDTPLEVARFLARYAPKRLRSILDPAAGSGVLLWPFVEREKRLQVQLLDVNAQAIAGLREAFGTIASVTVDQADFLWWASKSGSGYRRRFDCIVMNPPFAARRNALVRLTVPWSKSPISVPVEAAFLYNAAKLVRAKGRLLSIVPASVISGESTSWIREYLATQGNIRLIHELPHRTFSGIEGRMYILVFERGATQRALVSRNHRLINPDQLQVTGASVLRATRLDYRYHEADRWYKNVRQHDLGWTRLGDVANVFRGAVDSPVKSKSVLHTTNMVSFRAPATPRWIGDLRAAHYGDIIMARVSRNSALTPILYKGKHAARCSDCLLIIRSIGDVRSSKLLFALRFVIAWELGAGLLERGVGATYITASDLRELLVPTKLAGVAPDVFNKFAAAVRNGNWSQLPKLEAKAREATGRCE